VRFPFTRDCLYCTKCHSLPLWDQYTNDFIVCMLMSIVTSSDRIFYLYSQICLYIASDKRGSCLEEWTHVNE